MIGAVVVFARRPEIGHVKTRLEPMVGAQGAYRLYHAFLLDTLRSARESGALVLLAHSPGPLPIDLPRVDFAIPQRGEDFGSRFDHALGDAARALPEGSPWIVIGADTPHLSPSALRKALGLLDDHDTVLGRSSRGGFHLLGFAGPPIAIAPVFQAADECQAVAQMLERSGRSVGWAEECFDVDEPADLARLAALVVEGGTDPGWMPSATLEALQDLGLAPRSELSGSMTGVLARQA